MGVMAPKTLMSVKAMVIKLQEKITFPTRKNLTAQTGLLHSVELETMYAIKATIV